jgi:hypothetical protein
MATSVLQKSVLVSSCYWLQFTPLFLPTVLGFLLLPFPSGDLKISSTATGSSNPLFLRGRTVGAEEVATDASADAPVLAPP